MVNKFMKWLLLAPLMCASGVWAQTGTPAQAEANPATASAQDSTPLRAATVEKVLRIALLLPTRSENLATAAQALRAGVMAGHEREGDNVTIDLIETDDVVPDILSAYHAATNEYDLIIGPMARSAVTALAQNKEASKPTLLLGQPESTSLPANLLAIGLSMEDEARQLALLATGSKSAGKCLILSTNATWQRRAARAFANQMSAQDTTVLELVSSGGYLSASSVKQLKSRLQTDKPNVIFIALDADQTRQIRPLLPADIRLYGSSQLNIGKTNLQETEIAEVNALPEGMHILDLPWQLQPDHSAVMIYPRLVPEHSADLERLYALGIDAYRIAREIGLNRQSRFKLDGVTGRLSIQFGQGVSRFERQETAAVYRGGNLQLLQKTP